jgi:hypothetical protein
VLGFQLDQTFFGFNPKDRVQLHENLFNIIWFGEGRWTFNDIYYMPLPMRRFWTDQLSLKLNGDTSQNSKQPNTPNIAKPPR